MNGTVFAGTTAGASVTTRSPTFNITLTPAFKCAAPPFTAVQSVRDAGYAPLRLTTPMGGDVQLQTNLQGTLGDVLGQLTPVDLSFDVTGITKSTVEVVNSATGFSPGAQDGNQPFFAVQLQLVFDTRNASLTPGAYQMRFNFTSGSTGGFSALSDEFYIAQQAPCVGLSVASASSGASPTSGASVSILPTNPSMTGPATSNSSPTGAGSAAPAGNGTPAPSSAAPRWATHEPRCLGLLLFTMLFIELLQL
ncbi:hypothetical protein C8R47DRAFT_1144476 [Mycena vitilis]|nr:hypothetical protein C8R47DRAFT_1144476 [Mycena vitilis]